MGRIPRKSTGFFSTRRIHLRTFKYEMTDRTVPVSGFAWGHSGDLTWDCPHSRHAGFGSRTKTRTSSRAVVYPERALWSDRLARLTPVGLHQPEAGRRRIRYVALPGSATALHRPHCSVCLLTTALHRTQGLPLELVSFVCISLYLMGKT